AVCFVTSVLPRETLRLGRNEVIRERVSHFSSLSNRARTVSTVLINTVGDTDWTGHTLELLTSNPLVWALRPRSLRKDGRSLEATSKLSNNLDQFLGAVPIRVDIRRERHSVIGPVFLVHLLDPQHIPQGQVSC